MSIGRKNPARTLVLDAQSAMKFPYFSQLTALCSVLAACAISPMTLAAEKVSLAAEKVFYVAPHGTAQNDGSAAAPVDFDTALKLASAYMRNRMAKREDGLAIEIAAGRYEIGSARTLGPEFKGSAAFPITIRAAAGAEVVFDGQTQLRDPQRFAPVTDPEEVARLAESARDHVRVVTVENPELIEMLGSRVAATLLINGDPHLPSVFPNDGYANLSGDPLVPEVAPPGLPKDKQAYRQRAGRAEHQEPGKKKGFRGSLDEPRGAIARIDRRSDEMAGKWQQWQAAVERNPRRVQFAGFYEAVWKESRMHLYAVDAELEALHFPQVFSYGFGWLKHQPFRVWGLLCELDQPGEWHYDPQTRRLFLYPDVEITADTRIGAAVANGFLNLNDTEHVSVIGLTVENVGQGSIFRITGSDNQLIGCRMLRSTARGAEIGGTRNAVRDCDFVDLYSHLSLNGGRRGPSEITPGNNVAENCHFHHEVFTNRKVNISIGGVGQTFRHNLVHNSIGQAVMVRGNDHVLELNEFFNIGYEEGDGAAVYAGADLAGYGTIYRHNFFHHLMRTPNKKLGRAGIMMDDHQAGATIEGNVFFKSTDVAVQLNSGAGHTVRGNTFVEGKIGIMNLGHWGVESFKLTEAMRLDPEHLSRGSKEDYIGRVERWLGKEGWNNEPWASKYPLMRKVLNTKGPYGRMWPIFCTYEDNVGSGNRVSKDVLRGMTDKLRERTTWQPTQVVERDAFVDYEAMDFRLKSRAGTLGEVPFHQIGLRRTKHRPVVPDPAIYRVAIRDHYRDQTSWEPYKYQFDSAAAVKAAMPNETAAN